MKDVLYHVMALPHALNAILNNRIYGLNSHRFWSDGRILWNRFHPDYSKHQCIIFTIDRQKIKQKGKLVPYNWRY